MQCSTCFVNASILRMRQGHVVLLFVRCFSSRHRSNVCQLIPSISCSNVQSCFFHHSVCIPSVEKSTRLHMHSIIHKQCVVNRFQQASCNQIYFNVWAWTDLPLLIKWLDLLSPRLFQRIIDHLSPSRSVLCCRLRLLQPLPEAYRPHLSRGRWLCGASFKFSCAYS